jgi:hypothetical protein
VTPAFLLAVGSRSGSLFALLLFAAISGALGFLVARRLRRPAAWRAPRRVMPVIAGWSIFLGPLIALYLSSLDGFYDIFTMSDGVRLRYFVPAVTTDIRWTDVHRLEAVPQYRGTWRLRIVTALGSFESATARRDRVEQARAQLMMSRTAP